MMKLRSISRVAAVAAGLALAPAAHAALIHAYDFSGTTVHDSVGTADGTLVGGATVSGGALHLDGTSGYVQFAGYLVPGGYSDFSVLMTVAGTPNPGTYTEMISQGYSSSFGFYIGTAPGGGIRVTDNFGGIGHNFPTGTHTYLLTSGAAGSNFYIDNSLLFTSATQITAPTSGTATRLGRQFEPYAEYFAGDVSNVRIYDSVVTPVPEPAAWGLMLAGFAFTGAALRRRLANPNAATI